MKNAPEGSLRIGKTHGCVQYYQFKDGTSSHGRYIKKDNINLAKELAQKSYYEKVLRYSEKTSGLLARLLKEFEENKVEAVYLSEHIERQKLIRPVEPTYEQRLETWLGIPYEGKAFSAGTLEILSNNGVRVRSKSEKILADYFESLGIKYKYECPLDLKPYGTIYPDFTFLSRRKNKEIYWEHEGMMDNPEYAQKAVKKIGLYEKNGIFPGEDLILTFESSASVIDTKIVKAFVEKYLI